jgi:hypothetical protein
MEAKMAPVLKAYLEETISGPEFCAAYLVGYLSVRSPGLWPGSLRAPLVADHSLLLSIDQLNTWFDFSPGVRRRLAGLTTLGDIFNHFALKSTPLTVNRSVLKWSQGTYDLVLMFRIPRPEEVLDQQKLGKRCVSVLTDKNRTQRFILGERDALSFTMHDLIHADHFYHDNQCYQGQLGFYGLLDQCLTAGHFDALRGNEAFMHELEYLIADMNAYPTHLFKCFKSALIHYGSPALFKEWSKRLDAPKEVAAALDLMNHEGFTPDHDRAIISWLDRYRLV